LISFLNDTLFVGVLVKENKLGSASVFNGKTLNISMRLLQLGRTFIDEGLLNLIGIVDHKARIAVSTRAKVNSSSQK
jgi:hypothetical protein